MLSDQEKKWILARRLTRLTDNQEVLIYPMGAERYLSAVLQGKKAAPDIKSHIVGKKVLVIPGYGNTGFLFAEAGAQSVMVCDKDPVTLAWIKAFKQYFYYRTYDAQGNPYPSIGELLTALTGWYPPYLKLPNSRILNRVVRFINPNQLRRTYILYMMSLVCEAITAGLQEDFELEKDIQFYTGEVNNFLKNQPQPTFDTAFVPYLLGVRNGIEQASDIVTFIKQLLHLVPEGRIFVTPARDTKEFLFTGKRYFFTSGYPSMRAIPELEPFFIVEDDGWFRTQGLAVFKSKKKY